VSLVVGKTNTPVLEIALMTGLSKVLLLSVSDAALVTTVPVAGNTASDLTPVPPELCGRIPVTAAPCDKLMAPNVAKKSKLPIFC
jgi:hypothetical protein